MGNVEVTEKSIVEIYEILSKNIVNELSTKYKKNSKLIRIMIETARMNGFNLLEAKEFIKEFYNY